jgi:ribosomal protein S18 acetylase RimI-like enzyme
LGLSAGTIQNFSKIPDADDLANYAFSSVKIPIDEFEIYEEYNLLGFDFVTLEFNLQKTPLQSMAAPQTQLTVIRKTKPEFKVAGFDISGSRFNLDSKFRDHLPETYWDESIIDHCTNFADFCICAISNENSLQGIISCFSKQNSLDLFLVAVHPACQSQGVGRQLLAGAENFARDLGLSMTTSVVSQNTLAQNFYLKNGFHIEKAEYVLHYWRN